MGELIILPELDITPLSCSNITTPGVDVTLAILRFGNDAVVSIPISVAANGGEVSFGGQHNDLSPSLAGV